ncbi:MAG: hypothetical protein NVS3B24_01150 [Candidatus Dormibacteria bacterium]
MKTATHRYRTVGYRSLARAAAALAAVVAISACGSQMDHGSTGGMGGMDMSGASKSVKATLAPANATAGGGTANVAVVKDQVHVDVRAQQLTAVTKYTAHLHRGSCASIGDIVKTVGDLQTDGSGTGSVHLEYGGTSIPTPAFVDIHTAAGTEGPAVCGDLR